MLLLEKFHKPAPRYTSYPTAPEWGPLSPAIYDEKLRTLEEGPLSLYVHIPFCHSMCLYCACSVVLNRNAEKEVAYVDALCAEIDLVAKRVGRRRVVQLHFGGGTPTKLSESLFKCLFAKLQERFTIDFTQEVALEIDPRTVEEGKLTFYRELGFNRVSFGVQDTDPRVQEAVKRRQSWEMTRETYLLARKLNFETINVDLIYGLPFQTVTTFRETIRNILTLRPDRIALFSYAKVPWLKPHQKAIKDTWLPDAEEKFAIYEEARARLIEAGYVAIGMDHFALEEDALARCYREKRLQRNFQGYSARLAEQMVSFGVTAIGFAGGAYVQNVKELDEYYAMIARGELPVARGKVLTEEDHLRKWVIHTLMCNFELDKREFESRFGERFDDHFPRVIGMEELMVQTPEKITITPQGELFIRNVAMAFDAYQPDQVTTPRFSQSI